jgi:hypothetical protein
MDLKKVISNAINEVSYKTHDGMVSLDNDYHKFLIAEELRKFLDVDVVGKVLYNEGKEEKKDKPSADVIGDTLEKAKEKAQDGETYSSNRSSIIYTKGAEEFAEEEQKTQISDAQEEEIQKSLAKYKKSKAKNSDSKYAIAKLYLVMNGRLDASELTEEEKHLISNSAISMTPVSGNFYVDESQVKMEIPGVSNRDIKDFFWENADKINKIDGIDLAFRSRPHGIMKGIMPPFNHKPTPFKPQTILKSGDGKLKKKSLMIGKNADGGDINVDVVDHGLFDKDGNLDTKGAAINCLSDVNDNIMSSTSNETKEAWTTYNSKVVEAFNETPIDQEKIAKAYSDFHATVALYSEAEASEVLKNYGEISVYLGLLAQGKEVYLPTDPSYPIADIIMKEDNADPKIIAFRGISVKSTRKGSKAQGAATSNVELLKNLINKLPKEDRKYVEDYIKTMAQNSIHKIDRDKVPEKHRENIGKIQDLASVDGLPDPPFDSDILAKMEKSINKYIKNHEKVADSEGNRLALLKEIAYREYKYHIQREIIEMAKDIPVGFLMSDVIHGESGVIMTVDEDEHLYGDFEIREKSSVKLKTDKNGEIVQGSTHYDKGENGWSGKVEK